MTVKYPSRFNESLPPGFNGIFHWDFLKTAFAGTKIEPTDIDAIVERHGKFLIFETKQVGKEVPMGQRILLENLIKLGNGNIHVIIIYGKTENDIVAIEEWWYSYGSVHKQSTECNAQYVLERVTRWFKDVNTRR